MRKKKRKSIIKKLIFVFIILLLFCTIFSNNSFAEDDAGESFGGKLLKPIIDLIVGLGDVIMHLIHYIILGSGDCIIRIDLDNSVLEVIVTVVLAAAVLVVVALLSYFVAAVAIPAIVTKIGALATAGAAAAEATAGAATGAALSKAAVGMIIVASVGTGAKAGLIAGAYVHSEWFGHEAVLTLYQVTPEEIISGELPLLNANFFSNSNTVEKQEGKTLKNEIYKTTITYTNGHSSSEESINKDINSKMKELGYKGEDINCGDYGYKAGGIIKNWTSGEHEYNLECESEVTSSPNTEHHTLTFTIQQLTQTEITPIAMQIKSSIAKWYYTLRNIALLVMMPILVYIGIRMIFTSISAEKSKYKNMLQDWVIAICLMFVMQYIMSFSMNIVESITNLVKVGIGKQEYAMVIEDKDEKIEKALNEEGLWDSKLKDGNKILWSTNNLMGLIRTQASIEKSGSAIYMGYALAFMILVWYTIFFLFTYIRRIIYLAFLTVIAPLVAMTYPLDKINDGKAQAFDMWLKEYIFNLLIQPVHLALYILLISMAFELASTNVIYTLVALGFMMPAEKLLRRFFGFEKAQTPGIFEGATGAALMMNGLNHILKRRSGKKDENHFNGGNKKDEEGDKLYSDTSGIDDRNLFDDGSELSTDTGDFSIGPDGGTEFQDDIEGEELSAGIEDDGGIGELSAPMYNNAGEEGWSFSDGIGDVDWTPSLTGEQDSIIEGGGTGEPEENIPQPPQPQPTIRNNRRNRNNSRGSIFRGLKSAGQEAIRQKSQAAIKSISSGEPIRKVGNVLMGAAGAGVAGTIGLTAIAANGFKKTGQGLAATTTAGYLFATSGGKKSKVDNEEIMKEYQKGYYGNRTEYKKAKLEEQRQKFIENEQKIKELQEKMNYESREEAKRKMEEYSKFIDAGFSDTDDIATMIKMVEEQGWSQDKAMTVAKFSNKLPTRPSKLGKKEKEDFEFKCKNIAKANNVPNVDEAVEKMRANAELYGKTKDNLNEINI